MGVLATFLETNIMTTQQMRTEDVPLDRLYVSSLNVRRNLEAGQEDSGIADLAQSINSKGLLSPLTVRPDGRGDYEVIVGQRRLAACRLIDLASVPCIIREGMTDVDAQASSLIENIHRADMHPMDKARALRDLHDQLGSYERVAGQTGWSTATVRRYVGLLDLPEVLQAKIGTADGTAGIGVMSRIARTFSGDDAVDVHDRIGGFSQRVQDEIVKRSDGDVAAVERLADEALEGVFDIRNCGAERGCAVIRDVLAGHLTRTQFDKLVADAGKRSPELMDPSDDGDPIRSFWKTLALSSAAVDT